MHLPRPLHRWNITSKRAIALQAELATRIKRTRLPRVPVLVAGGDATISRDGGTMIAGWVVWDRAAQCVVEEAWAAKPASFPYVPGLLSFREAPVLLAAAKKLRCEPGLFMFDGQGLAHPRRMGLACHVGLFLDRPSLGCAKSRLCGEHTEPGDRVGDHVPLRDGREIIGRVLRTREGVKPVFVSIGHRIMLGDAVKAVLACCTKYRLPEPTRLAHQFVTRLRADS